ncbi:MAG: hypothetical protein ACI9TH_000861 [Kiritimatiellia bacterium]|jgi:hypothetical protein
MAGVKLSVGYKYVAPHRNQRNESNAWSLEQYLRIFEPCAPADKRYVFGRAIECATGGNSDVDASSGVPVASFVAGEYRLTYIRNRAGTTACA